MYLTLPYHNQPGWDSNDEIMIQFVILIAHRPRGGEVDDFVDVRVMGSKIIILLLLSLLLLLLL